MDSVQIAVRLGVAFSMYAFTSSCVGPTVPARTLPQTPPAQGIVDPSVVTPLASFADSGNVPVTLRANTAALKDQNLGTYSSISTPGSWPNSGSFIYHLGGFAQTGILGAGTITGVQFFAFARYRKDPDAVVSNCRFLVTTGFEVGTTSQPPVGPFSSVPAFAVVSTPLVLTKDGTNPWSWATLYNDLLGVELKADYSIGAAFSGEFAQIDAAEVWCEIHGPVGNDDSVAVRLKMGDVATPSTFGFVVP